MTKADVLGLLHRRVAEAGSQADVARAFRVSTAYLGQVLNGERTPGPAILRGLGLAREEPRYRRL